MQQQVHGTEPGHTVHDFDQLARREGFTVERCYFLSGRRRILVLPNLLAEVAVYLVRK